MEERKKTKKHRKRARQRLILISCIGAFAALIALFLGVSVYFENHFFPHTTILGVECGGKDASYVEDKLRDRAGSYLLTILDRKGEKNQVRGADIDCRYVNSGEVAEILSHQVGASFLSQLSNEKIYEPGDEISFDEGALRNVVAGFPFMDPSNMEPPKDAALSVHEGGYDLTPEEQGTTVIPEKVQEAVREAVKAQEESLTISDDCYEKPQVTTESPEIASITKQFDAYMQAEITYDIEGMDVKLGRDEIMGLISLDQSTNTVSLDAEKVKEYAQSLASKVNTYGRARQFQTAQGDTITIGGGDYGWVLDKAAEAEQIITDLTNGKPVTREPIYEQTALCRGENDIGNTYVEIDYTNQHLYYFENGALKEDTDIVSGNINRNNGSPDGVFKIVYKQSPATLVGENYSSDVTYFMPFAYNVGIHDASWRSQFGGEIYKSNGSHGCINVPEEAAKTLYDILEVGTPVIAYYRSPVALSAENARISNAYSYDKEAAQQQAESRAASDAANAAAAAAALAQQQAILNAMLGIPDPAAVPAQ